MRRQAKIIFGTALLAASAWVGASDFDGSKPLLCAVTNTVSCDSQSRCNEGPATAVNMPVFIKIDVQAKKVQSMTGSGDERISDILEVHQEEEAVVLRGFEQSAGWSAAISASSGHLTVTAAARDTGYMLLGACTPQENVPE